MLSLTPLKVNENSLLGRIGDGLNRAKREPRTPSARPPPRRFHIHCHCAPPLAEALFFARRSDHIAHAQQASPPTEFYRQKILPAFKTLLCAFLNHPVG